MFGLMLIISDAQSGFRSGRGTSDSIFVLHSLLNNVLNRGKRLYCTFIYFRKAFDYVSRDCLWYKMLSSGIRVNMYNVIHSMYGRVKSQVRFDDSVFFAETREGLQKGLDIIYDYCTRWRLTVNTEKTKVVVFRRGGQLSRDDHWFYGDRLLSVT